jgi:hypothetical protein
MQNFLRVFLVERWLSEKAKLIMIRRHATKWVNELILLVSFECDETITLSSIYLSWTLTFLVTQVHLFCMTSLNHIFFFSDHVVHFSHSKNPLTISTMKNDFNTDSIRSCVTLDLYKLRRTTSLHKNSNLSRSIQWSSKSREYSSKSRLIALESINWHLEMSEFAIEEREKTRLSKDWVSNDEIFEYWVSAALIWEFLDVLLFVKSMKRVFCATSVELINDRYFVHLDE